MSELVVRVPNVGAPLRADPEIERMRLFDAVTHVLKLVGEGTGVVVILDDLHWADKGTLLVGNLVT